MLKLKQLLTLVCFFLVCEAEIGSSQVKYGSQVALSNAARKESMCPQLANILIKYAPDIVKNLIADLNNNRLKNSAKLLLYGETGVGKTDLAKAISLATKRECTIIHGSSVGNEYQNSGAQNIRKAFEEAVKKNTPQVLLIEEIDALVNGYNSDKQSEKNTSIEFWLMLDETENNPNILVIGTTNDFEKCPQQVQSRFGERKVQIFKPDTDEQRSVILLYYLDLHKHVCNDQAIGKLAKMLDSFAPRQIKQVVSIAVSIAKNRDSNQSITSDDLEKAIKQIMSNCEPKNNKTTILESIENGFQKAVAPVTVISGTVVATIAIKKEVNDYFAARAADSAASAMQKAAPIIQKTVFAAMKKSSVILEKLAPRAEEVVIGFIRNWV